MATNRQATLRARPNGVFSFLAGALLASTTLLPGLQRSAQAKGPRRPAQRRKKRLRKAVSVLTFHDLSHGLERTSLSTPAKTFEKMLRWLEANRYRTYFASDVPALLRGGHPDARPGEGAVVITFDDGYANNYRILFPILKKYKVKMTLYLICSKILERHSWLWENSLTWDEVREMVASGLVEIGSHTYRAHENHPLLMRASRNKRAYRKKLHTDLVRSKHYIKDKIGKTPVSFAWPHGRCTPELVAVARQAGFPIQFRTGWRLNVPGECRLRSLARLNCSSPFMTASGLANRLKTTRRQAIVRLRRRRRRALRRHARGE